jgi:hypothetical protein
MLTRRAFLTCSVALWPVLGRAAQPATAGILVPRHHASLWRGLRFGEKEAKHTAQLLGRDFALIEKKQAITIYGPVVTINQTLRLSPNVKGKVAWHPRLTKFGAGELNERFARETKHEMDEQAWLGWVVVKIVAEAMLRNREIAKIKVDGHKGVPLYFDAGGQLVQPLYDA